MDKHAHITMRIEPHAAAFEMPVAPSVGKRPNQTIIPFMIGVIVQPFLAIAFALAAMGSAAKV
jgi:hypothetical protein